MRSSFYRYSDRDEYRSSPLERSTAITQNRGVVGSGYKLVRTRRRVAPTGSAGPDQLSAEPSTFGLRIQDFYGFRRPFTCTYAKRDSIQRGGLTRSTRR